VIMVCTKSEVSLKERLMVQCQLIYIQDACKSSYTSEEAVQREKLDRKNEDVAEQLAQANDTQSIEDVLMFG